MAKQIKAGYKQTKVGIIPEDWDIKKIGDILRIGSGKDYKHLNSGNIPVFGTGGYMLSVDKYLYSGESVCIGRKGTIDKPIYLNCKFWTVDTLFYTYSFNNTLPLYIYFTFLVIDWKKYNEATGVPSLSKTTIENILIAIPPLAEQEKIAEILTTWDNAIIKHEQLIEQKQIFKKGLMQQIFSQQLRFKDDNDNYYPDWQTKKLGDIGYFQTSSVDKLFKEDETEVYLFNYMDVYKKKIITNKTIRVLNKTTAKDSQIKNNNLKKGDILFTPSSETPDDIGHSVVIMEDLNNCVYSYHVLRFRPTLELDLGYSNYCCNNNFVLQQFSQNCTGSTRFTLSLKSFSNTIIHLPILEEQTKIANLLTSIDDEIERLKQMLAELKLQKQSLMQKLLTGQIRVRN